MPSSGSPARRRSSACRLRRSQVLAALCPRDGAGGILSPRHNWPVVPTVGGGAAALDGPTCPRPCDAAFRASFRSLGAVRPPVSGFLCAHPSRAYVRRLVRDRLPPASLALRLWLVGNGADAHRARSPQARTLPVSLARRVANPCLPSFPRCCLRSISAPQIGLPFCMALFGGVRVSLRPLAF